MMQEAMEETSIAVLFQTGEVSLEQMDHLFHYCWDKMHPTEAPTPDLRLCTQKELEEEGGIRRMWETAEPNLPALTRCAAEAEVQLELKREKGSSNYVLYMTAPSEERMQRFLSALDQEITREKAEPSLLRDLREKIPVPKEKAIFRSLSYEPERD